MHRFMTDSTPALPQRVLPWLLGLMMVACAGPEGTTRSTGVAPPPAQPESASGLTTKSGWRFQRQAVAAANPLATEAGAQVLRAGGSAVDAAIAVQMVLNLVEPQSSGIGGGGFMLLRVARDGREVFIDARERAPSAASRCKAARTGKFGGHAVGGLCRDGGLVIHSCSLAGAARRRAVSAFRVYCPDKSPSATPHRLERPPGQCPHRPAQRILGCVRNHRDHRARGSDCAGAFILAGIYRGGLWLVAVAYRNCVAAACHRLACPTAKGTAAASGACKPASPRRADSGIGCGAWAWPHLICDARCHPNKH